MPKLTVDGRSVDVPEGQRLVLAIESNGTPIGHRCGGFAKCTTCRVEFIAGEPQSIALQMPVWSPGDYHVQNHAKYVSNLRAWDGDPNAGHPLTVTHPDPNTWIGYGPRSIDDMSFAWITLTYLEKGDFDQRAADRQKKGTR